MNLNQSAQSSVCWFKLSHFWLVPISAPPAARKMHQSLIYGLLNVGAIARWSNPMNLSGDKGPSVEWARLSGALYVCSMISDAKQVTKPYSNQLRCTLSKRRWHMIV